MTLVALAGLIPAALTAVLWPWSANRFSHPRICKPNYRGVVIPCIGGIVPVVVAVLATVALVLWLPRDLVARHGIALAVALGGFAVVGVADDLSGGRSGGGFSYHLGSLARGRVTTGLVKMLIGGAVAVLAVAISVGEQVRWTGDWVLSVGRGGALVALSANLANLLDRAPGRTAKVAVGWWTVLLIGTLLLGEVAMEAMVWTTIPVAAVVGVLRYELREQLMLGDTGVNPLGASLGLGTVVLVPAVTEWVVLAVVAALNIASERISFSAVIDSVAPLRRLDRMGSPYRS